MGNIKDQGGIGSAGVHHGKFGEIMRGNRTCKRSWEAVGSTECHRRLEEHRGYSMGSAKYHERLGECLGSEEAGPD